MDEIRRIPESTRHWLRGILQHGEKASKITKRSKYLDDSNYAVELILKILSDMEELPKNLQPSYVNLWKTARAYGKKSECKLESRCGSSEDEHVV